MIEALALAMTLIALIAVFVTTLGLTLLTIGAVCRLLIRS